MEQQNKKNLEQYTWDFIGPETEYDKTISTYFKKRERKTWQTISQTTTRYGTIEKRDPDISKQKKYIEYKKKLANWNWEIVCWNYQSLENPETG